MERLKSKQRTLLNELALKFHIRHPSDWGRVSSRVLDKYRSNLLHQSESLQAALQNSFPDVGWQREWFETPKGFWTRKENQRIFLDTIASKLKMQKQKDWGSITSQDVIKNGGWSIMRKYEFSIQKMLAGVYPGTNSQVDTLLTFRNSMVSRLV